MARPKKQGFEQFPHSVVSDNTIYILENVWGNDGYAFWYKLMELLCKSDGLVYDYSPACNQHYLCAYMKMTPEKMKAIIDCLVDLDELDSELWQKKQILWCQKLADKLIVASGKRAGIGLEKPYLEQKSPKVEAQKKKPKQEDKKLKYGEFVKMTEAEHEKLVAQYGEKMTARMVQVLDNYKGSNGKTYKNDYRAILNWVVDRVKSEFAVGGGKNDDFGAFRPSDGFRTE